MSSPAVQPLLALLACPVGGNPAQYIVERTFADCDLDWRYLTFEVGAESLADAVRGLRALGFRGAHLAAPHKQAVIPLLDRTTDMAATIGAVNLALRQEDQWVGENTEGKGVVQALRNVLDPAGKQAVVLGEGPLARAVAVELAASSATVSEVSGQEGYIIPPEAEILIHATSPDQAVAVAAKSLRPELLVIDATAVAAETQLLGEARACGCRTIDGLTALVEQLAIDVRLWTGVEPNRQIMREAAEEFLGWGL